MTRITMPSPVLRPEYKLHEQVLEFEFLGETVKKKASVGNYPSGLIEIHLYDPETREPFCDLSINAAGINHQDEVILKNYSEHEDWVDNSLIPHLEDRGFARLERYMEVGRADEVPVISLSRKTPQEKSPKRTFLFWNYAGEGQVFEGFNKTPPASGEKVTLALVSYEGDFECYFLDSRTQDAACEARKQLEEALLFMHGDDEAWGSNHTIRYYKPQ